MGKQIVRQLPPFRDLFHDLGRADEVLGDHVLEHEQLVVPAGGLAVDQPVGFDGALFGIRVALDDDALGARPARRLAGRLLPQHIGICGLEPLVALELLLNLQEECARDVLGTGEDADRDFRVSHDLLNDAVALIGRNQVKRVLSHRAGKFVVDE